MYRLQDVDPEIFDAIERERRRQEEEVILIASENTVSRAVLEAMGSVMTNKYAEGYPGKRYYGGCQFVDVAEQLAIDRARALFGAEHVNVQPHSGTQANMAVLLSALKPGDAILTMNLAHGGHLSHGHPKNFSGMTFRVLHYGVHRETERIDLDEVREIARRERPKLILSGASAYSRTIDFAAFSEIAREIGAVHMVDMAHIAGLVAAKLHPDPVPHAEFVTTTTHKTLRGPRGGMVLCREAFAKPLDSLMFPGIQGGPLMHVIAAKAVAFREALTEEFRAYQAQIVRNAAALAGALAERGFRIVSGGTDNHLFLVDLRPKGLTGKVAEKVLGEAGITLNKNLIPYDPETPMKTSGVRIGTPTVTSRGMREEEMRRIGEWIDRALAARDDEGALARIRGEVREVTARFPIATSYLSEPKGH